MNETPLAPMDPQLPEREGRAESFGAINSAQFSVTHFQSGPLPPAEALLEYEKLFPGAGEMMLREYEAERQHDRTLERAATEAKFQDEKAARAQNGLGQIFGLVCFLGIIAVCIVLACLGHGAASASLGTAAVAGFSTIFVVSRKGQKGGPHA